MARKAHQMEYEDIPLAKYVIAGGGRQADPINRVAPCIMANIEMICAVQMSCAALSEVAADGYDKALSGASAILGDVADELDMATHVLMKSLATATDEDDSR